MKATEISGKGTIEVMEIFTSLLTFWLKSTWKCFRINLRLIWIIHKNYIWHLQIFVTFQNTKFGILSIKPILYQNISLLIGFYWLKLLSFWHLKFGIVKITILLSITLHWWCDNIDLAVPLLAKKSLDQNSE